MVQHTNHAGLIELYYAIPGAPWIWDKWKAITGIENGIFPSDPADLPAPMTPSGNRAVKTYFEAYRAIPSIEQRHIFASKKRKDAYDEGREHWSKFINSHWRRWKIQATIHAAFTTHAITFIQVMVDNDLPTLPSSISISDAYDTVAYDLFGDDALTDSGRHRSQLVKPLQIICQNAAANLRKTSLTLISRTKQLGGEILGLLQGEKRFQSAHRSRSPPYRVIRRR